MDWEKESSGTWYIERSDTRGKINPLPDRRLVDDQYERAADYLVSSTKGWVNFVEGLLENIPAANFLTPPKRTEDGSGLPGQFNSAGYFPIERDSAIIITLFDSPAQYQSIQIGDLWFNALDYCHHQTSLTMAQLRADRNNCYKVVISAQDPGVANWIDPAGASTAFAFLRWQGVPECHKFTEAPRAEVVEFQKLREYLPNEPCFSPQERVEQLAARQEASLRSPRGF